MHVNPPGVGGSAMSAFEAARDLQISARGDAPAQYGELQNAEDAAVQEGRDEMLSLYQRDTHNDHATATQMEANQKGFNAAKQELISALPTHARSIEAIAQTLATDYDVGRAEEQAGDAHASADVIRAAGIVQLNDDLQKAAPDVAAFISQSPDVQALILNRDMPQPSGDAKSMTSQTALDAPLAALHTTLAGIQHHAGISQAEENGIGSTMTDIDLARGIETPDDRNNALNEINAMNKMFHQHDNELNGHEKAPQQNVDESPEARKAREAGERFFDDLGKDLLKNQAG